MVKDLIFFGLNLSSLSRESYGCGRGASSIDKIFFLVISYICIWRAPLLVWVGRHPKEESVESRCRIYFLSLFIECWILLRVAFIRNFSIGSFILTRSITTLMLLYYSGFIVPQLADTRSLMDSSKASILVLLGGVSSFSSTMFKAFFYLSNDISVFIGLPFYGLKLFLETPCFDLFLARATLAVYGRT